MWVRDYAARDGMSTSGERRSDDLADSDGTVFPTFESVRSSGGRTLMPADAAEKRPPGSDLGQISLTRGAQS